MAPATQTAVVVRPVYARITQPWGQISGAALGVIAGGGRGGHPGVDYGAILGTEIDTIADGEVTFAGYADGFGPNTVCVYHPAFDITSTYGHMEFHAVWVGQQVKAGQKIGYCGSMGQSTGPHLHFEIRPGRINFGGNPPNIDSEAWLLAHIGGKPQHTEDDIMSLLVTIDTNNALNMQHPAVRTCQALLAARGGWINGAQNVDHKVFTAVLRWFQQSTGLSADGICGPATWAKLVQPLNGK